jgi:hypothetical protein
MVVGAKSDVSAFSGFWHGSRKAFPYQIDQSCAEQFGAPAAEDARHSVVAYSNMELI